MVVLVRVVAPEMATAVETAAALVQEMDAVDVRGSWVVPRAVVAEKAETVAGVRGKAKRAEAATAAATAAAATDATATAARCRSSRPPRRWQRPPSRRSS